MYHNRAFRKLGRTHTHRIATLRALSTALFERERIRTTLMKAKELRPFAEKLITRGKRDDLHARRLVLRHIQDRTVVKKLFEVLSPRYASRQGGYMRILRLGPRPGDGAEMALVELIGSEPVFKKEPPPKKGIASRLRRRGKEQEAAAEDTSAGAGSGAAPEAAAPEAAPAKGKATRSRRAKAAPAKKKTKGPASAAGKTSKAKSTARKSKRAKED